jgi:hypothetical protein
LTKTARHLSLQGDVLIEDGLVAVLDALADFADTRQDERIVGGPAFVDASVAPAENCSGVTARLIIVTDALGDGDLR